MTKPPQKKDDDQKRDALLKRLLETPPKPHLATTKPQKKKLPKSNKTKALRNQP